MTAKITILFQIEKLNNVKNSFCRDASMYPAKNKKNIDTSHGNRECLVIFETRLYRFLCTFARGKTILLSCCLVVLWTCSLFLQLFIEFQQKFLGFFQCHQDCSLSFELVEVFLESVFGTL